MRALDRKLIRDLLGMKGQVVAIALVMSCGIATFVMSLSALGSLERTLSAYYDRHRFADVFALLKRAPNSMRERIEAIPGVAQVQTRIVRAVTVDVEGFGEPVAGRFISVEGAQPTGLNTLYLRQGRWLDPLRPGEALVSDSFARAHGLEPGDSVEAIINGKLERIRLVGMVLSPEFVYSIREGELLPDERRFAVMWMNVEQLEAAFNMEGAFNDVALTLEHGGGANEQAVIARLDELLAPYGSVGAYGREDHASHEFVANEIRELRSMALVAPSIFLSVAAFLLNIVISRLVSTQREQIAMLKAIGYSRFGIGRHYFKLVLVIALIGTVLGLIFGAWLGRNLTGMYSRFFHFPEFDFALSRRAVVLALGASALAALLGTALAVWRATQLPAAEAMRPEAPAAYRPMILERLGLRRLVSPAGSMILRHLERRPLRSGLTTLGIAMSVAMLVVGAYMSDAIHFVVRHQFELKQRQQLTIGFVEPTPGEVLHDVEHLPGVQRVEPFRLLPARIRAGHLSRRVGVMGLIANPALYRLVGKDREPLPLPEEGLVLSEKLAQLLHVQPGDSVTLEVLESERPVARVPVATTVREYTGVTAYMNIAAANRLMHRQGVVSGAFLTADRADIPALYAELKRTPHVSTVSVKAAALESFENTVGENIMVMRTFNVIFACVIAFGVVYNSARIGLSERGRELATLRVVGFTRGEIAFILLGELAVLVAVAVPAGLLIGYGLAAWTTGSFDTELFRLPLVIQPSTYGFAAVVTIVAAIVSGLAVRRRLNRLDLVSVLKTRE